MTSSEIVASTHTITLHLEKWRYLEEEGLSSSNRDAGEDMGLRVRTKIDPLLPLAMRMPCFMYVVSIHPVGLEDGHERAGVKG